MIYFTFWEESITYTGTCVKLSIYFVLLLFIYGFATRSCDASFDKIKAFVHLLVFNDFLGRRYWEYIKIMLKCFRCLFISIKYRIIIKICVNICFLYLHKIGEHYYYWRDLIEVTYEFLGNKCKREIYV